jgi:hypothetical protein
MERADMQSKKSPAKKFNLLALSAIIVCLVFSTFTSAQTARGIDENYTYYGVVPSKIWRYILPDGNNRTSGWTLGADDTTLVVGAVGLNGYLVATKSLLAIVASEDDTNVEVRDLTLGTLLAEAHLASMEKELVLLPNGTHFKVVSDKIVSVLLLNYQREPSATANEGPLPHTFYTSVDGLYVGKRFVFMASEQSSVIPTSVYTILALEKSTVTVTDEDGGQNSYSLEINSYEDVALTPFKVYEIESTGNIMVQSIFLRYDISDPAYGNVPCFPVPCAQGGFVGTFFIARSVISWDANKDFGYRIAASEDAHVQVYDLETQQVNSEFTVTGGSGIAIKPKVNAIIVQSDKPVTLSLIHNGSIEQLRSILSGVGGEFLGYGHGVMFRGIKPDQDTMIHLPVDANVEAYFFASEATQLTIDGNIQTIQANTGFLYTVLGTHTVSVDHNVVLQINFWPLEPEYQGLWYTGAIIPCVETVDTNPTVTITTIGGGGLPIMYIAIGGGAAAVVVVVVVLVLRKRGSKSS